MTLREQGRRCSSQMVNQARFGGLFYVPQKPYSLLYRSTAQLPLSSLHRQAVVWEWLMKVMKWIGEKIADNLVGLALTTVGGLLVVIVDPVRGYVVAAWDWLASPTQLNIGFLILSLIMIITVLVVSVTTRDIEEDDQDWSEYKRQDLEGIVWRWNYSDDGEMINVQPHCPNCDCLLELEKINSFEGVDYICHMCGLKHFWPYRCASRDHAWMIAKNMIEAKKRRIMEQR